MTENLNEGKHEVRIHIDRKPFKSPTPTDGETLYALGHVKPDFALYQEVQGDEEDRLVPKGKEHIRLEADEHFYSAHPHKKVFTIIVNGRPKEVGHKVVSYTEIVVLASIPGDANTIYTVTYKKGRHNAEGTLVEGQTVKVKDGMIFNVTATSKS
jgi:Multiubiquitin